MDEADQGQSDSENAKNEEELIAVCRAAYDGAARRGTHPAMPRRCEPNGIVCMPPRVPFRVPFAIVVSIPGAARGPGFSVAGSDFRAAFT